LNPFVNHQIICVSPVDWRDLRQRPQILMEFFRELTPVLYLNPVGLRSFRISDTRRVAKKFSSLFVRGRKQPGKGGIEVITPLYIPFLRARKVNRFFYQRLARSLAEKTPLLKGGKPILWIGVPSPLAVFLLENLDYSFAVYDCMDDFAGFHGEAAHIREDEITIVRNVDLVMTASQTLLDRLAPQARMARLAPNGVDSEPFRPGASKPERPSDMESGGPIIGYHGAIREWFDVELIRTMAKSRPSWRIVLIGPVAPTMDLTGLPANVHLLGPKPHDRIPAYLRWFDVGIIPFVEIPVAFNSNPIKTYEYLAAGLPVVSSPIAELRKFDRLVRIASGTDEFIRAVDQALDESGSARLIEERLALAEANSWQRVFQGILNIVRESGRLE
jgi:glycosyltransferase involved in cell wall biosynthesis